MFLNSFSRACRLGRTGLEQHRGFQGRERPRSVFRVVLHVVVAIGVCRERLLYDSYSWGRYLVVVINWELGSERRILKRVGLAVGENYRERGVIHVGLELSPSLPTPRTSYQLDIPTKSFIFPHSFPWMGFHLTINSEGKH